MFFVVFCGSVLLLTGCKTQNKTVSTEKMKFKRLFCWGIPNNEKNTARYASAGVTDIRVMNQKQYDLVVKYGMTPYWKCFIPVGPYIQVMTPEEQKHHEYISGQDLDRKIPYSERMKIIHKRRTEIKHLYGGEPVTEIDTIGTKIACFNSDEGLELSKKKIDKLLEDAPKNVKGMFMDYIGYMNHRGCYCKNCLTKYRKYLEDRKLADTPESRTVFYREKLVEYYNGVIDYIKSKRPDFKILVHIYPDFRNDPLLGNRTKADYCGQTVSWYFKWDEKKIRKYTDFVLNHAQDHYSNAEGIPFIGINENKNSSLAHKTPAEVERELQIILECGSSTVMVCNGTAILQDGYYEVFRKYCGKE